MKPPELPTDAPEIGRDAEWYALCVDPNIPRYHAYIQGDKIYVSGITDLIVYKCMFGNPSLSLKVERGGKIRRWLRRVSRRVKDQLVSRRRVSIGQTETLKREWAEDWNMP